MYLAKRHNLALTYLLMIAFSGGIIIGFISAWLAQV